MKPSSPMNSVLYVSQQPSCGVSLKDSVYETKGDDNFTDMLNSIQVAQAKITSPVLTFQQQVGNDRASFEFQIQEADRLLKQGLKRKALIALNKLYERMKNESCFTADLQSRLCRRYLAAGTQILRIYEARGEFQQKQNSLRLLKKVSLMVNIWYVALQKMLDKRNYISPQDDSTYEGEFKEQRQKTFVYKQQTQTNIDEVKMVESSKFGKGQMNTSSGFNLLRERNHLTISINRKSASIDKNDLQYLDIIDLQMLVNVSKNLHSKN